MSKRKPRRMTEAQRQAEIRAIVNSDPDRVQARRITPPKRKTSHTFNPDTKEQRHEHAAKKVTFK